MKSIQDVIYKLGSEDFRDIHASGSHVKVPNDGGLILHKNGSDIELLSSDKQVSKAFMSKNEEFVAFQTSEQLNVLDQDNLEDVYVIDVDTKNIIFQSDAHGDKPTNAKLISVKDTAKFTFQIIME